MTTSWRRPINRPVVRLLGQIRLPLASGTASVLLAVLTVVAGTSLAATAGWLLVRASQRPDLAALTIAIVATRLFGVGRAVARYFERLATHDAALRWAERVRLHVFRKLIPMTPGAESAVSVGDRLTRVTADIQRLQNLPIRVLTPILLAATVSVVAVLAVALVSPVVAFVVAVGLLVGGAVLPGLVHLVTRAKTKRIASLRAQLMEEYVDLLVAAPELIAYGVADQQRRRVVERDRRIATELSRESRSIALLEAVSDATFGAIVVLVTVVAARQVEMGSVGALWMAPLVLGTMTLAEVITPLLQSAIDLDRSRASAERLSQLEVEGDVVPVTRPALSTLPIDRNESVIQLEHVTFAYRGQATPVLTDYSLTVSPGQRVALVGPSGRGKSTIAWLTRGLLKPSSGTVRLWTRDVALIDESILARNCALVFSDGYVFNDSVRFNVTLGDDTYDDLAIEAVLREVELGDWYDGLAGGLQTRLGDGAVPLSGGERQRLLMARALITEPSILLLDEPTVGLDTERAVRLMSTVLRRLDHRVTVLLITHDPDVAALCDGVETLG